MNSNIEINRQARWSIIASMIMIFAGIVALALPGVFGIAATVFIGSLLIVAGVAHFGYAWFSKTGGSFLWGLLLGIVYAATGFYILLYPSTGLSALTLVLAAYLFLDAILEFVLSFYLRAVKGKAWLVFDGCVMLALGLLICWTWLDNASWVVGVFVGASMVCCGMARLMFSLMTCRVAKPLIEEKPAA